MDVYSYLFMSSSNHLRLSSRINKLYKFTKLRINKFTERTVNRVAFSALTQVSIVFIDLSYIKIIFLCILRFILCLF